ncbi:MAG: ABC transporter permease [Acidimicrobiales bacterium]
MGIATLEPGSGPLEAPEGQVPAPGRRAGAGRRHLSGHGRPWRRPYFLEGITWLYLAWSILPIAVAILFSFNSGKSITSWQGFSMRWYITDPTQSVLHDPTLHVAVAQTLRLGLFTTIITVPLGVAFAIGIDRWRGRTSNGLNFVMIFSFVVPELLLAVALMFVFTQMFTFVHLGTIAEVLALVVWNVSWPAVIVRARLVGIGKVYEEAAADLGASKLSALRRVLVPMLTPAVFASAVLVFASVIDDFVLVEQLSSTAATQSMSVIIYGNTRGGLAGPALNALATLMLVFSLVIAVLGYIGYRFMTRGERGSSTSALTSIAGM